MDAPASRGVVVPVHFLGKRPLTKVHQSAA